MSNKKHMFLMNLKVLFKLINKLEETAFSVDFNDAFIVATRDNIELSINRVSGDAKINNNLKWKL